MIVTSGTSMLCQNQNIKGGHPLCIKTALNAYWISFYP